MLEALKNLLREGPEHYKKAMLLLWLIARSSQAGGGARFNEWAKGFDKTAHLQRRDEVLDWLTRREEGEDYHPPFNLEQGADCLALLSALDECLAERTAHALPAYRKPVTPPGADSAFWLLPRQSMFGFLHAQTSNLAFFHPRHVVVAKTSPLGQLALEVDVAISPATWRKPGNVLRIAVAAFEDRVRLKVERQGDRVFFPATDGEAERLASALEMIDAANREGAHILLFPELTLSPGNQRAIQGEIAERKARHLRSSLLLLGLGSFHDHCSLAIGGTTRRNRAYLIDGRDGRPLLYQDKLQIAQGGDIEEEFQPADRVNTLLTPWGLMAVAICKDLFDAPASDVFRDLTTDWLLVPSMSDKLEPHREKTSSLWKRHRCISVVANQPFQADISGRRGYLQLENAVESVRNLHIFDIDLNPDSGTKRTLKLVK